MNEDLDAWGCLGAVVVVLLIVVGCSLLGGVIIWVGWNYVVVPLFSMPEMTYWQGVVAGMVITFIGSCFKATTSSKD